MINKKWYKKFTKIQKNKAEKEYEILIKRYETYIEALEKELAEGQPKPTAQSAAAAIKFEITSEEYQDILHWQEQHISEKHNGNHYFGAIGGNWTYEFLPTSIGEAGTIKCNCGETFTFREL